MFNADIATSPNGGYGWTVCVAPWFAANIKNIPHPEKIIYVLMFNSYLMVLDIFQNAAAKTNPPIGLLNDKNIPRINENVTGSLSKYEANMFPKTN